MTLAPPGVLMVPLEEEKGWSRSALSTAVGINLMLYGLISPFAAAFMDRFGIRPGGRHRAVPDRGGECAADRLRAAPRPG